MVMGVRSYPDWWKALPNPKHGSAVKEIDENDRNMKRCFGFTELYKRSFILESWCDMNFRVTPDQGYFYTVSAGETPQEHNPRQYEGAFREYYHTKLIPPWHIREKSGVMLAFIGADYHHDAYNFKIVPGLMQYVDSSSTNVNILMPKLKQTYDFFIPIGLPLVHFIPLVHDKKFEVKNHLVTIEEMNKIRYSPRTFAGYHNLLKLRNRNEEREKTKSKCPFHFG
jgi:hypothetical protein